ncbi:unnamed protein product [Mycena citricolor]|uniref:Uncharacterized protein n=1 Tax=Mycena citricolor TaxID=2018698 RepID=A0AAD2HLT8_9AGAR|nr:unnamed protein product [Mycena citricolor]
MRVWTVETNQQFHPTEKTRTKSSLNVSMRPSYRLNAALIPSPLSLFPPLKTKRVICSKPYVTLAT